MILTNVNDNHFHLAYYNNTILDMNFYYNNTLINNNNNNIEETNSKKSILSDVNDNICDNDDKYKSRKFNLKDLSKCNLEEILEYYKDKNKYGYSYSDIYYYKYTLNKNNNVKGEYTENFLKKYKNKSDLRNEKKKFKRRIKNFNIGSDNYLKKFVYIKDSNNDELILKNLIKQLFLII